MIGTHCIKSWSSTQKNITLSSGEAELVAAVRISTEAVGLAQLLADWGEDMEVRIFVDSSAAIGMVSRRGNGKMRHVKVGMLWIQEKVESGELAVEKVAGTRNPADMMTKNVPGAKVVEYMEDLGQTFVEGRAEKSLKI